jgi:hypothetical protein
VCGVVICQLKHFFIEPKLTFPNVSAGHGGVNQLGGVFVNGKYQL